MAHAAEMPTALPGLHAHAPPSPTVQSLPVTPGKVAMWLFLATEIMFFTGLIGSYIVLRSGSPPTSYSDKYAPATSVVEIPKGEVVRFANWPVPYDPAMNPLSIDLTAGNTFILICSSVTMVLALSAVQRGDQAKFRIFMLSTCLIGAVFLSVQVFEYYQLMFGHHYPIGISRTGHFRPDSSLFASCFFTMTGFHGAHVFGGVVMLSIITARSFAGAYTPAHHSPVELAGLYWHFVDLVWIILFTVVYLI